MPEQIYAARQIRPVRSALGEGKSLESATDNANIAGHLLLSSSTMLPLARDANVLPQPGTTGSRLSFADPKAWNDMIYFPRL